MDAGPAEAHPVLAMQPRPVRLWSIRSQVVALAGALVLPFVAGFAWFAWSQYQAERERQGESLLQLSRAMTSSLDRELASGLAVLQTLATSILLREGRLPEFHRQMQRAAAIKPGSWIVLWDESGQMLANTLRPLGTPLPNIFSMHVPDPGPDELPKGNPWSVREAFQTGEPTYSNLFIGLVGQQPLVAIDVPVLRRGKVTHVLSLSLPTDSFQAIVSEQKFPATISAGILDRRHFAIARAVVPEQYVGKRVTRPLREAIERTPEEWGEGRNHEGRTVLHAFSTSRQSGWVSVVGIDEQAAMAPFWRGMAAWAGGLGAFLLLITLISWWLHWRVVAPVRALAASARTMEAGRPLSLPAMHTSELADLASALATAAAAMREREQERVRAAEAEARVREAAQASAAKDEFLALLSHELRNPLAAIALSAETLGRPGADATRVQRATAALRRQVAHLRRLVDDMLDLAAATHGKLTLQLSPVGLLDAARAAAATAEQRHPGVAFQVLGDPVRVRADAVRLEQMIGNLLDNAAKAQAKTVRIAVSSSSSWGALEIRDDGQGIAPELMPRLFEPFFQGDTQGLSRRRGGLGVGLTLVNRLAVMHGGALVAQSEGTGKGSTFSLRLPLAAPAEAPVPGVRWDPARPLRVLVAEDDADVRDGLEALLEMEGHTVAAAADGAQALDLMQAFAPDVALIDIGLPGIDGLEVARRARASRSRAFLIAVSGYATQRDRQATAAAGFDLHLAKPLTPEELKAALGGAAKAAA